MNPSMTTLVLMFLINIATAEAELDGAEFIANPLKNYTKFSVYYKENQSLISPELQTLYASANDKLISSIIKGVENARWKKTTHIQTPLAVLTYLMVNLPLLLIFPEWYGKYCSILLLGTIIASSLLAGAIEKRNFRWIEMAQKDLEQATESFKQISFQIINTIESSREELKSC